MRIKIEASPATPRAPGCLAPHLEQEWAVPTLAKQGKGYTIGEQFFNELAKGLDNGTLSRGGR